MSNIAQFPRVPETLESIVKPEELIDIIEMSPLTLQDRRIYNLLIGNAWNAIFDRKHHEISRQELTRYIDSNNQDIAASLRRLMSAIVIVKIRHNSNGRPSTRQIQLLGTNDIEDRGPIEYSFPQELVQIIKNTQIFARLHTRVMFELSSKYSLALYEFLQRRKNLRHIHHETLTVAEVRGLLGVSPGKLKAFGHLNDKAIRPAAQEVSFLTDYEITAEPIRTGRAVTHVKFAWSKKTDVGAQIAAVEELERSKVGREARMNGQAAALHEITSSQKGDSSPRRRLNSALLEKGRAVAQQAGTGWDILVVAEEFHAYVDYKGPPRHFERAWLGFVGNKVKTEPQ